MGRPGSILKALIFFAQGVKNSLFIDPSDHYVELKGDVDSPGNSMLYGTDGSGNKGWQAIPSASIADGSVTNIKLADMAQATIKGRASGAGTGVPTDLTASQAKTLLAIAGTDVSNTPSGSISATTTQAAINELATEKQPLDTDLTAIAALTPSNDDLIQRKSGAWANRTPAQVKVDLALTKTDVGLANVDNTSDVNKPVSTAQAAAIALKVSKSGDSMTGPLAMGANKITGLSNGTNPTDAAAFGQIPAGLPPTGAAGGDLSGSYPNPTLSTSAGTVMRSTITGGAGSDPDTFTIPGARSGTCSAHSPNGSTSDIFMIITSFTNVANGLRQVAFRLASPVTVFFRTYNGSVWSVWSS